MRKYLKFHQKDFLMFLLFTVIEVFIAMYLHDQFIRPFFGDVLVVMVLYFFAKSILRKTPHFLAGYVFLFAAGVEILQYFQLVSILHLENNTFFRVLLGTTFDVWDIVAYGIGCVALFLYQRHKAEKEKL